MYFILPEELFISGMTTLLVYYFTWHGGSLHYNEHSILKYKAFLNYQGYLV